MADTNFIPAFSANMTLSEALLDNFSAAMRVSSFDENLFDLTAGGNLTAKLDAVMAEVRAADVDALLRCQRPRFALLGADAEARMVFMLARKKAQAAVAEAGKAAAQTISLLQMLDIAKATLTADSKRLADVAVNAAQLVQRFLPPVTPQEVELRARFDRRVVHLSSLRAANALTLSQVPQAIAYNRELLNRFNDMTTVLFPVWERHALLVVQSPRDAEKFSDAFAESARALGARLLANFERAA